MDSEKKIILNKIDILISKRKIKLLNILSSVYEMDDNFIFNFLNEQNNFKKNKNIKHKKKSLNSI